MNRLGIRLIRAPVRTPCFNGKVERLFRTMKEQLRKRLLPLRLDAFQQELDAFARWYNTERPHQAIGGRTPDEAYGGETLAPPLTFRQADTASPTIRVERLRICGDPTLPVVRVRLAA